MYYGAQKLLGAFGGPGFAAQLEGFQKGLGIPPVFGALAVFAEFFGGLGMIVGLLTRVAAFGCACTMAVATFIKIKGTTSLVMTPGGPNPMNELGFPLALLAMSVAILLTGGGRYALDARFFGRKGR